jgi:hypothetical protein
MHITVSLSSFCFFPYILNFVSDCLELYSCIKSAWFVKKNKKWFPSVFVIIWLKYLNSYFLDFVDSLINWPN